MLSIDK